MSQDGDLVQLPFEVVECTLHKSDGDGWQSERGCQELPQTLVLKVQHENDKRMVHALEIICHESKVPEKVEISLGSLEGNGQNSFEHCKSILHLGYITLADPKTSGFQARELKSVPIDRTADFVQLVLKGCHRNSHNVNNQVGIVGIRVLGAAAVEGKDHPLKEDTVISSHGRSPPRTSEGVPMNKIVIGRMDGATVTPMSSSLPSVPSLPSVSSLPTSVKNQLDVKIQSSVDRLERLKKERASLEDFEMAGKIKDAMGVLYALLISFQDCQGKMREAAAAEDYALASRLKEERNQKRDAASHNLQEVEKKFIGRIEEAVGDLSISTIKDESFVSQRSVRSSHSYAKSANDEKKIVVSVASHPENNSDASSDESHNEDSLDDQDGKHPLEGVENAEELPIPEEINDNGDASLDLVKNVEDLFDGYLTKCFFSKNWTLREAALAKMTLLVPEVCSNSNGDCAEVICKIIEAGIEDKNVQVYLAALIMLDESMVHLESSKLPQSNLSSLLSRITNHLLVKLSDSKQKVVESSTLALLSMASSYCVEIDSITNAATKRIRSKDSKGGRSVKSRLQFLENLAAEFGNGVASKRVIDFAKGQKALEHKDDGVRDAAKSLIFTLMMIHGENILHPLEDSDQVSERQLTEFKSRFAIVKQR